MRNGSPPCARPNCCAAEQLGQMETTVFARPSLQDGRLVKTPPAPNRLIPASSIHVYMHANREAEEADVACSIQQSTLLQRQLQWIKQGTVARQAGSAALHGLTHLGRTRGAHIARRFVGGQTGGIES